MHRIEVIAEEGAEDRAAGEAVVAAAGEDILVSAQMTAAKFRTSASLVRVPRGCTEKEAVKVGILGGGGVGEVVATVERCRCVTGKEDDRLVVKTEVVNTWRILWIGGTGGRGVVRLMEEAPRSLAVAIITTRIERTREDIDARLAELVGAKVTVRIALNEGRTDRILGELGAYRVCSTNRF